MEDNLEAITKQLAANIKDAITEEIARPLIVAQTMQSDAFLIDWLENGYGKECAHIDDQSEQKMEAYLQTLNEAYNYSSIFIISDRDRYYYHHTGIKKKITDAWYDELIERNNDYVISVKRDDIENDSWTLYIHARIQDEAGKILGIAGIGIKLEAVQNNLRAFERAYHVKISLVDEQGIIKISTEDEKIQSMMPSSALYVNTKESNDYIYLNKGIHGGTVVKYIKDLEWYLVIQNEDKMMMMAYYKIISLNIFLVGIVFLILIGINRYLHKKDEEHMIRKAMIDQTTGLLNKNGYYLDADKLQKAYFNGNKKEWISCVICDINYLKQTNDNYGHLAGDQLIKLAAEAISKSLKSAYGIYRIGGDEFAAIYVGTPKAQIMNEVDEIQRLSREIGSRNDQMMSIAVGYFCGRSEQFSFDEMMQNADEMMYRYKKKMKQH